MSQMTAGKLAKACGMGLETVRFYERNGLLPKPQRLRSGYRVYSTDTVMRLRFIQQVKGLGFTLEETKDLVDLISQKDSNCEAICERVREKKVQVDEKITQLKKISKVLGRLVTDCPGGDAVLDDCVMMRHFNDGKL